MYNTLLYVQSDIQTETHLKIKLGNTLKEYTFKIKSAQLRVP